MINQGDKLRRAGHLKNSSIIAAFNKIRREDFLLPKNKKFGDSDEALPIGFGQTNSQPTTMAIMLELLQPQKGDIVLDVGSGSGWSTALLAEIVGPEGRVYGLELIKELKTFGEQNVDRYDFIKQSRVKILQGDGYLGLPEYAPFNRILVSAAADSLPSALCEQLAVGGCLVMPIGSQREMQDLVRVKKSGDGKLEQTALSGFRFVPLI